MEEAMGDGRADGGSASAGQGLSPAADGPCEAVGLIASRDQFEEVVRALLQAGFARTDVSVLASHESLDATGDPATPWRDVMLRLLGDVRVESALVASGAVFLAGGALAATLAALIGAAVGGVALKDVVEEVTSQPHHAEFVRSLAAGGLVLWVRADTPERLVAALEILRAKGAGNVHAAPLQHSSEPVV
jgi:hypothetical protein